jgi:hypothetical protein
MYIQFWQYSKYENSKSLSTFHIVMNCMDFGQYFKKTLKLYIYFTTKHLWGFLNDAYIVEMQMNLRSNVVCL